MYAKFRDHGYNTAQKVMFFIKDCFSFLCSVIPFTLILGSHKRPSTNMTGCTLVYPLFLIFYLVFVFFKVIFSIFSKHIYDYKSILTPYEFTDYSYTLAQNFLRNFKYKIL